MGPLNTFTTWQRACILAGCFALVCSSLLGSTLWEQSTQRETKELLKRIHRLGQTGGQEALAELERLFISEPLHYRAPQAGEYVRTAVVKELKSLENTAACGLLVCLARRYLPHGTQEGYFARFYNRSPEYHRVTEALFDALTQCNDAEALTFLEEILDNDGFRYEQQACLHAAKARIRLSARSAEVGNTTQTVDNVIEFLRDGIPDRKDYIRPGVRKKMPTLDLAAMEVLQEMGVEALSALRKAAERATRADNPEQNGALMLAIARIVAVHWEEMGEKRRNAYLSWVLKRLKEKHKDFSQGTVAWYIRKTVLDLAAHKGLSIRKELGMSPVDQEATIEKIRKAAAEARAEHREGHLEAMSEGDRHRMKEVGHMSAEHVPDELPVLVAHLKDSGSRQVDAEILELLGTFAADHPTHPVWAQAVVKQLLLVSEKKGRSVCAKIGKVIGRITRTRTREILKYGFESESTNVRFCSLMAMAESRDRTLLPLIVEFTDSPDPDIQLLARRILESAGIETYKQGKAEVMEQIRKKP